jgi:hypothetical protein
LHPRRAVQQIQLVAMPKFALRRARRGDQSPGGVVRVGAAGKPRSVQKATIRLSAARVALTK